MSVTIEPLGDSAWLLRNLPFPPFECVNILTSLSGVMEVSPSYESIAVFFDPLAPPNPDEVLLALQREGQPDPLSPPGERARVRGLQAQGLRTHHIPVCYEMGEDLPDVAARFRISQEEVIALHTGQPYRCHAIGFRPGFPYLGWLPEKLEGISRLPQPRVRVPQGSVAIADRQTGIYPEESPGGWSILGRTPLVIVDVEADYFPIRAGDLVQFAPITQAEFDKLLGGCLEI